MSIGQAHPFDRTISLKQTVKKKKTLTSVHTHIDSQFWDVDTEQSVLVSNPYPSLLLTLYSLCLPKF